MTELAVAMSNDQSDHDTQASDAPGQDGGCATVTLPRPARPKTDRLPPWNVLLHNDDVNYADHVVLAIMQLTTLREQEAITRMIEAHKTGVALLLSTHREHAELLEEQFASKGLIVTIEPGEA